MFAARYGYTIKEFYCLTMRQIFQVKKVIQKRVREDQIFNAELHNRKIKGAELQPINVSAEKRKEFDDQALRLLERLKRQHRDGRSRANNQDKR